MSIVRRRKKTTAQTKIRSAHHALLRDEMPPKGANQFSGLVRCRDIYHLWPINRESIMKDWIRERPGTRPLVWWLTDCPLEPPEDFGINGHIEFAFRWARDPSRVPSAADQRNFLAKNGLLRPGE